MNTKITSIKIYIVSTCPSTVRKKLLEQTVKMFLQPPFNGKTMFAEFSDAGRGMY